MTDAEHSADLNPLDKRFLQDFFSRAPLGMKVLDSAERILWANSALQQLLGYSEDEMRGLQERALIFAPDREIDRRAFATLTDEGCDFSELTVRHVSREGRLVWTDLVRVPVRKDGEFCYVLEIIHDISRRKELEQRLLGEESANVLGRLVGGIVHDFRNVLQIAMSQANVLRTRFDGQQDHDAAEDISLLEEALGRGNDLLESMRALVSGERHSAAIADLNEEVATAVRLLRPLLSAGMVLRVELEPSLQAVPIPPIQLMQIVLNLVLNARDASEEAGEIMVSTCRYTRPETSEDDQGTLLCVRDEGKGMAPEVARQIFDPFFTTKDDGTGLGLAVVHRIVEEAGGRVEIDSDPGRGTQICVYLPAAPIEESSQMPDLI